MFKNILGLRENKKMNNPLKPVIGFLSSMQLGIILLLLLAVFSVPATFRPHELAIETVYTSPWFIGTMAFTGLNLLLCTVETIKPLSRLAFLPKQVLTAKAIRNLQANCVIKITEGGVNHLERVQKAFCTCGLRTALAEGEEGLVLFGEKGKLGYLGSVVTHLSLLLILLGAMYGALSGFETSSDGMKGDWFSVPRGNFQGFIHDVILTYPDGPDDPNVITYMTITRNGREIRRGAASINKPLRFEGISVYQSAYFWVPTIEIRDFQTGELLVSAKPVFDSSMAGSAVNWNSKYFEDYKLQIDFLRFLADLSMLPNDVPVTKTQHPANPAVAYQASPPGARKNHSGLLMLNEPKIVETERGPLELKLSRVENAAYLVIARNLGRPYLLAGALFMVIGLYMSFFLFPCRFWAVVDSHSSSIVVGGRSLRNPLYTRHILQCITAELIKAGS